MLLNVHSFYSLRYGTIPLEELPALLLRNGYDAAVLTDINNSSGVLEFIKGCQDKGLRGYAGMEFRNGSKLLYFCIARNNMGFAEINQLRTDCNLSGTPVPETAPEFKHVTVVYPFGSREYKDLRDYEYIGVHHTHLTKVMRGERAAFSKYVIWQPVTFENKKDIDLHRRLRAIDNNTLLSQLNPQECANSSETLCTKEELLRYFKAFPQISRNTELLLCDCTFTFDFKEVKNRKVFGKTAEDDKLLLEKLAMDGWKRRYGVRNKEALQRVKNELDIIERLGFSSYFLITADIIRYTMHRGFYHVGRGSGANSVVAYCLNITDVCPIELDLYFERFLNPKRKKSAGF